jgi:O-antigen ligase
MTSISIAAGASSRNRFELAGLAALFGMVAALQFSIAVAQILLAVLLLAWAASLAVRREAPAAPPIFWPLVAYAGATLLSTAFSLEPHTSVADCKQLFLFLLVPAVYGLAKGPRATTVMNILITVGAASAVVGIVQYGVFHYDFLGLRPRGTLGHYMTYSGLLMLVIGAATAHLLFEREHRLWTALVMPALVVAMVLTFTRSAWVGACVAVALLFSLRDFRLLALLPVVVALFFGLAPSRITARFYSMFDLNDPTNRDRVSMLGAGIRIVRDYPLTGVGPNIIERVYPRYRGPDAVEPNQPHLHNVPLQIGAERGLIALATWLWFIASVAWHLARRFREGRYRYLSAAGLSALAAMLAAGMFEHNFGDSEFLMLFLVLITLPFAAEQRMREPEAERVPST